MLNVIKKTSRGAVMLLGLIKGTIKPADCRVHQFINLTGLEILKRDGYEQAVNYYAEALEQLQRGTIWADTGFSGLEHFYFPHGKKRGIGIFGNALELATSYEHKAVMLAKAGRHDVARFYVGALLHLIQDATIPHHAVLKLLRGHRAFELSVRRRYKENGSGIAKSGAIVFDEMHEYIQFASRMALKSARLYGHTSGERANMLIQRCVLPIAERLTAGYMLHFYESEVLGEKKQSRVTGRIATMDKKLRVRYLH